MTNTVKLVPAPLFSCDLDALPLAQALRRAFFRGDGAPVVSPALCDDDAEFLAEALFLADAPVSVDYYSPGGVAGVCLVLSF